jgi:hypothetical protein
MTRSYINRFSMHWRIKGKQSWRTSFCGGTNSARVNGGEHCYTRRTFIHRSIIDNITSHIGVDNGRNTTKVDGDGVVWSGSGSKSKTHNHRHNYDKHIKQMENWKDIATEENWASKA